MADNLAVQFVNDKITELQDRKRQADAVFEAAAKDHAEKTGRIDAELRDWAEVLERYTSYVGAVKSPRKTTTKK